MSEDITNFDLFDRYLEGKLASNELANFERKLNENAEFKTEFQQYKDLIIGVELAEDKNLKETIIQVQNKLKSEDFLDNQQPTKIVKMENTKKPNSFKRFFPAAVAAMLLLTAGYFFLNKGSGSMGDSNDELFARFYKPEKANLNKILDKFESAGMADPDDPIKGKTDSLSKALFLYERGEYENARTDLVKYISKYPEDKTALLYLGLSLLNQSEYAKAAQILSPLTMDKDFEFRSTAMWYTALSYTMFNSDKGKSDAIKLFKKLETENLQFADDARIFLDLYE